MALPPPPPSNERGGGGVENRLPGTKKCGVWISQKKMRLVSASSYFASFFPRPLIWEPMSDFLRAIVMFLLRGTAANWRPYTTTKKRDQNSANFTKCCLCRKKDPRSGHTPLKFKLIFPLCDFSPLVLGNEARRPLINQEPGKG